MSDQPQATTNPVIDVVSMNYRYISAWNEINTRITLRQNAVTIYVTLSGGVITLSSMASKIGVHIEIITLLMPCVAIACALLYKNHDDTIAILRDFLVNCETFHASEYEEFVLMGYNSSPKYLGIAHKIRKLHDWTFLFLVILFNAVGIYVSVKFSPIDQNHEILIGFSVIATLIPFIILKWRNLDFNLPNL